MRRYNIPNVSYADVLRRGGAVGTKFHQTNYGLVWTPPQHLTRFASHSDLKNVTEGATIRSFELQNRSGSAANMGVGFRLANRCWIAGRYDGTTFTDVTSSVQTSTGTATLGVDGADNTGFAIGCFVPFDWMSVNITTAEVDAGSAVDHTVTYSNALGTGFSTATSAMTLTDNFTLTNTVLTAAVKNFVWQRPYDWGPSTAITGLVNGLYWLYVTTADKGAGDTAPICTGIEIGIGRFREGFDDYGIYASESDQIGSPYADGVVAYFSTADAGNLVSVLVESGG